MSQENSEKIIRTEGVKVNFGDFWALKGITTEIAKGEIVVIMGPSGSGKSTYIRTLNRLQPHSAGTVIVDGITIDDDTSVADLKYIRAEIGFVFQQFNLFPHLTIMENITMAPMKVKQQTKQEAEAGALKLLERVGIPEQAHKYPSALSGGQQQRVAIARAIAGDRKLLLADEPTGNLDIPTSRAILELFHELCTGDNELSILMVTHDAALAARADRMLLLRDGCVGASDVESAWGDAA